MQQKKSINLGFRGWMLVLFQACGFLTYQVFTNYPLNILRDLYGGQQTVSLVYTAGAIIGIIVQLLLANRIARAKSVKKLAIILGVIANVIAFGVALVPAGTVWYIVYALANIFGVIYGTFTIGIIIGQWFPRRKGTVMGIATIAFPLINGAIGLFASSFGTRMGGAEAAADAAAAAAAQSGLSEAEIGAAAEAAVAAVQREAVFMAFLPFLIISVVGLLIGLIFVTDYPEQCGAYRDNDKSFTPEIAQKMLAQEIENRKTTVWTAGKTLSTGDFWLITLPMGLILMFAVGAMTQTQSMVALYEGLNYETVMAGVMVFGIIGSWVIGILDTKLGTRQAMLITTVLMIISGAIGMIQNGTALVISLCILALFMGASSNFTVSGAVQYWRIEDYPSVFAVVNPVANVLCSAGPMIIAQLMVYGEGGVVVSCSNVFLGCLIAGVIGTILLFLFNRKRLAAKDNMLREKAGKPVDDLLASRK